MTRRLSMLFCLSLAACGSAKASDYDSANPLHCVTIFSAASGAGIEAGNAAFVDEMSARMIHIAKGNGGAEWLSSVRPRAAQLGAEWNAAPDRVAVEKLFLECRAKVDRDPAYSAALPELLDMAKRINPGLPRP